jgi:formylglycine-generating enzyme required for sulfatase activity
MVGNVWEWCDEIMNLSAMEDMPTSTEGYITEVATYAGIANWPVTVSIKRNVESPGYFFIDLSLGEAAIARGGSCDDGEKAGIASLRLDMGRQESDQRTGFRCVR